MGLVEDIGTYLAGASTRFVLGTKTFLNYFPDTPNRASAIHEYAGPEPDFVQGPSTKPAWENARFQVACRSTSSTAARGDINTAWALLNGIVNQTLSGTTYLRVAALQSPFLMERDKKGRPVFACNFQAQRRP